MSKDRLNLFDLFQVYSTWSISHGALFPLVGFPLIAKAWGTVIASGAEVPVSNDSEQE